MILYYVLLWTLLIRGPGVSYFEIVRVMCTWDTDVPTKKDADNKVECPTNDRNHHGKVAYQA